MHFSSMENMQKCFDRYIWGSPLMERKGAKVLDVGGADVNGSYSDLFPKDTFRYLGVDLQPGPGISVVLDDPNRFPLEDKSIDVVVSGQMLEHCANFWLVFTEMVRVVKDDGYIFMIAPSSGPIHRYPVDCYRFYPDSFQALADYAGCYLIDRWMDGRGPWQDLIGVFSRTPRPRNRKSLRPYTKEAEFRALIPNGDGARDSTVYDPDARLDVLQSLHTHLEPRAYLEIGVGEGRSLALATCPAVGVDPVPELKVDLGRYSRLIEQTSDEFFDEATDPILKAKPDLVVLDGMRLFEYALRDFMHVERICHPGSVIAVDNVLPAEPEQGMRVPQGPIWLGDVWKLIPTLQTWRPDLKLDLVDTKPGGLLLISGLNPQNRVLWEQYNPLTRKTATDAFGPPPDKVLQRDGVIDPNSEAFANLLARLEGTSESRAKETAQTSMTCPGKARSQPKVSVVVISYNMSRELPRTLRTLSPDMQEGVGAGDVEIIVVDNGSTDGFDAAAMKAIAPNIQTIEIKDASPSPVEAINRGLSVARGDLQGVMIDGARMASPGLLARAIEASTLHPRAVIGTIAFHLGPKVQMESVTEGYNQTIEDELLAKSGWEEDGYKLFDISVLAGSSAKGWLSVPAETNALFMKKALWDELGGFDPVFQSPGGGYVNLDTWKRATELPNAQVIMLLGEATFHQVHGGVATNAIVAEGDERPGQIFKREYRDIRGAEFAPPTVQALFHGQFVKPAIADNMAK